MSNRYYQHKGSIWNRITSQIIYWQFHRLVHVSGVSEITLKFGGDISALPNGVFDDAASEKIFEDKNKGTLA